MTRKVTAFASVIYLFLCVLLIINSDISESNFVSLIVLILPPLLLFAALRYPDMTYSRVLAAIPAFWVVFTVLATPFMLALFFDRLTVIQSIPVLYVAFMAYCIFILIYAIRCAVEADKWVSELREKKKAEDSEEGTERMTKGLVVFLRPRQPYAIMYLVCFLVLTIVTLQWSSTDTFIFVYFCRVGLLLLAGYILRNFWNYNRYIRELTDSGVLSKAASDYYNGHVYYEGHLVLGVRYIFVEGKGRLIEYSSIVKIYHKWKDSRKYGYWRLYAVNKDGKEMQLLEVPYKPNQKNYDEYVYPVINEIRMRNENIVIEGPGEFSK